MGKIADINNFIPTIDPESYCNNEAVDSVISSFWSFLKSDGGDMSVAAVHSLAQVILKSGADTILELFLHLRASIDILKKHAHQHDVLNYLKECSLSKRLTTLPLISACEHYQQFALEHRERRKDITLDEFKSVLATQAAKFAERISQSKRTISEIGIILFTRRHSTVLTHGRSSCVEALLRNAWNSHKQFSVFVTRHENIQNEVRDVDTMIRDLRSCGIKVQSADAALVSILISEVDLVVVGAEAVLENGGIINRFGTASIAMLSNQLRIPFYVACEASKFSKSKPLQQYRITQLTNDILAPNVCFPLELQNLIDYTPASFITLFLTDLGIFSPNEVSQELTRLYK